MLETVTPTPNRRFEGRILAATAFLAAFLSVTIGFAIGNRWLLPILNTLFIFPFYISLVARGRRRQAVALILLWAIFMSQFVIAATCIYPERASKSIIRGNQYKAEMFDWIKTGKGKESSPSKFIPSHALELLVFCALAVLTAGFGALLLGAVLLNYMNFYVGSLLAAAKHPILTAFLVWQPYSIVRVIGYIFIATALSEAVLRIILRRRANWSGIARYAVGGFSLVVLDVIVKASAAGLWAKMLKATTGL